MSEFSERRYTAAEMREAFKQGARETFPGDRPFPRDVVAERAAQRWPDPLPPLLRRPGMDPHDPNVRWEVVNGDEIKPFFADEGTRLIYAVTGLLPTRKRLIMWGDLMEWPFLCGEIPCKEDRTLKPGGD